MVLNGCKGRTVLPHKRLNNLANNGTFRYKPMDVGTTSLIFARVIWRKDTMQAIKYSLRPNDALFSAGITDLRQSHGGLVDTNGCIALFVTSGCAVAPVNFKRRPLRRGDFVVLLYDGTFSIERSSALFSVRYASFAYDVVEEAIYKPLSDRFWDVLYGSPVFRTSAAQKDLLDAWWRQLGWMERMEDKASQEEMLKNSIRNLLIAIDTEVMRSGPGKAHGNEGSHAWMLITRFFKLVSLHCRETREVAFYASRLSITTTYLYKLCRKHLQMSPKEMLDRQTVTEIKTYLVNTDVPVKGIADALHFEDVSYMCRYFRRMTGMSPMDYRRSFK